MALERRFDETVMTGTVRFGGLLVGEMLVSAQGLEPWTY
jgi:hypothetical protein